MLGSGGTPNRSNSSEPHSHFSKQREEKVGLRVRVISGLIIQHGSQRLLERPPKQGGWGTTHRRHIQMGITVRTAATKIQS